MNKENNWHICVSITKNCYATGYSYGEICTYCNCCGRIQKGLEMWKARLEYQKNMLSESENFNSWATEYPDLVKIQEKNVKLNIKYHKNKIKSINKKISKLQEGR